mmetsp:Transcript_12736/g.12391  ORF Transcript_12736/g.12391 Transcript_12736/m.12391 type:complete len:224 (+) Transcript_12736:130-801(+)|eukprot:CAMPEP_0119051360 /NCGR_PEP_ID=MMETSP1177-20130426/73004_1 /TAXON_ID=2985 /ORGANISM="Ochromonas sp, Strain CCMP1899" /LENGTH=223 /DNA_ID=CAMNT_0007030543 /DNA_START=99 /DNA_END=770 /DNA_ORIENTATION=-
MSKSNSYRPVSTAPDIHHAYPVGVLDVDSGREMDYREMSYNPVIFPSHIVQPIQPARVEHEYPGSQVISQIESNRIKREIVKGDPEYLEEMLHEDDGIPESRLNAKEESNRIKNRLKNGEYYEDRDEPFNPKGGNSVPTYPTVNSKEEKLAQQDSTNIPGKSEEGYQMSDYKSVYENEGGIDKYETAADPYNMPDAAISIGTGYKVADYKSEYEEPVKEDWRN